MTRHSMLTLVVCSVLWVISQGCFFGAFCVMSDLSAVKEAVSGMELEIGNLLLSEGYTVGENDVITVVGAQHQDVAGVNYRVALQFGPLKSGDAKQTAVVQYFIDLVANDPSQTPQNLKLVKRPSRMLKSIIYKEEKEQAEVEEEEQAEGEEKEDNNLYHNKKYERLNA